LKKQIYYKNKCLLTDNEIGAKNQILGSDSLDCEMTSLDTVANLFTAYVFARHHAAELLFHLLIFCCFLLKYYLKNSTKVIIHRKETKYRFCLLQQYLFLQATGSHILHKNGTKIKQAFGRTIFVVCNYSTKAWSDPV